LINRSFSSRPTRSSEFKNKDLWPDSLAKQSFSFAATNYCENPSIRACPQRASLANKPETSDKSLGSLIVGIGGCIGQLKYSPLYRWTRRCLGRSKCWARCPRSRRSGTLWRSATSSSADSRAPRRGTCGRQAASI